MRRGDTLSVLIWLILLAGVLGAAAFLDPSNADDRLIRWTVRLALLYWTLAATLMLLLGTKEWQASGGRGRLARWCWTFAWATYLVHLAMSFHFYHHWSHTHAMEHTRDVSGFAEGIFVSHLFTLVWTLDVLFWWWQPVRYARRPRWVGWLLHAFMVFIIFNGTVVYETGVIRWAGIVMFGWLGVVAVVAGLARRSRLNENTRDELPPPASSS